MTTVMVGTARFRFVLATMAFTTGTAILGALFLQGWQLATAVNVLVDGAYLTYIVTRRDGIIGRLFLMGVCAATVELLLSDPAFVRRHVLVYDPGGPFVVDSPLYMPLSWIFLIVQIGALSRWAFEKWGLGAAMVVMAVLGGVNGPMYEYLAQYSHLWRYQECWMIRGVPVFVIVAEVLIGLSVPLAVLKLPRLTLPASAGIGLLLGLWTWVTGLLTFALVGAPRG
jgi:hypothetical protein